MEKYVAVDAGKFATKVALYNPTSKKACKKKFRTKIDDGDFRDDDLQSGTYIVEVNGETYKVGNGAVKEAKLEMTKLSKVHTICALTALALAVEDKDEVHVAIGCPLKEYEVVEKRERYKNELLPLGEVYIKIKSKDMESPIEKTFTIASIAVYAESTGILYISPIRFAKKTVGVIDIGGATALGNVADNFEPNPAFSMTTELGGNVLVNELSQELSAKYGRVDESLVAKLLKTPTKDRYLVPKHENKKLEEESRKVIHDYIINFCERIKRACDAKNWSLDFMELVFTGGTSEMLASELREVFGNDIYIPTHSEYTNVVGFLKKLVARKLNVSIDTENDFTDVEEEKNP